MRDNPAFLLSTAGPPATRKTPPPTPRAPLRLGHLPPPPTAEQLEREGAALVVEADGRGELSAEYRFLDSAAGGEDLSIADVAELLRLYRATMLRCEAMARAADARAKAWKEAEEEDEGGGATTTATTAAAAEGNFVPSPPVLPLTSSSVAAATTAEAEVEVAAAATASATAPEAELDLSLFSLSPLPSTSSLSAAPPLQQQQRPSPDVAHLLTPSATAAKETTTTATTITRAAEAVETIKSGSSASLI